MKKLFEKLNYFSKFELILWLSSLFLIVISFILFDRKNYLTLIASLIGATSLIFSAKSNPTGLVLMIIFSIIYGIISFYCAYYGEMITYMGMTLPMSVIALVSWLKNPYKGNKAQVKINRIGKTETLLMLLLTTIVTFIFYFLLKYFNTANLIFSTLSVSTSFAAVYLTARRSPYFAVAYALNDIILTILWTLAAIDNTSYISMVICFVVFLVNDVYGFINWRKTEIKQRINE